MEPARSKGVLGTLSQLNGRLIARTCPDGERAFFASEAFPWVASLQRAAPAIAAELDAVMARREHLPAFHTLSRRQAAISDERWKTFFFFVYGHEIHAASARCPATRRALASIPGMSTAMFSILEPGIRIPPHQGPHKGVLRFHLGLRVPSSDSAVCGIRVRDQVRPWKQYESLIFDDTFEHEAWNLTSADRIVLFVDFERPLPRLLAASNRAGTLAAKWLSADVREARRNAVRFAENWDRRTTSV